jgi:basic membrane protein A and related proteins
VLQRRWLRIIAALLGLALVAAACGNDDDATETGDGDGDGSGMRIGLVYDIGGRGDQSFNDAAFRGLEQAQDELGVEIQDLEPTGSGEDREELLRTLAEDGYDMVIGVGFASQRSRARSWSAQQPRSTARRAPSGSSAVSAASV